MVKNKIRMTAHEVMQDLRERGFSISQKSFNTFVENGTFPFVKILSVGDTGRRTYMILRRDYESWLNGFLAEGVSN